MGVPSVNICARKIALSEAEAGIFGSCFLFSFRSTIFGGHAVAQLVEALRYMPEGRGFDSRWCQWNFSLT